MQQRIGWYISRVGAALFAAGFLYLIWLTAGFMSAPITPVAASGQIIPWSNHGTFHYITVHQSALLNWTLLFCGGMFCCGALGVYLEGPKQNN
jgi:hypothetical protein